MDFVDLILISNVPAATGLPYLASRFSGKILMTKPVSKLAKAYWEELVTLDEISGSRGHVSNLYSQSDIDEIWSKVDPLAYTQKYQFKDLYIQPVSSGHSIGSSNWLIQRGNCKALVISDSCLDQERYTTPFELPSCNILIFTPSQVPYNTSYACQLREFKITLLEITRSLGYFSLALLPIAPWMLLDLENQVVFCGQSYNIPMLTLSPSARSFFTFAAGSTEWLNNTLKVKAYVPKSVFEFEDAKEKGMFQVYQYIREKEFARNYRTPSILMCSHSSFALGEAKNFLEKMKVESNNNYVILTDPEFQDLENTGNLGVYKTPLRVGLTTAEVQQIVESTSAQVIAIPYTFRDQVTTVRTVVFYDDNARQLPYSTPTAMPLTSNFAYPGFVQGTMELTNYNYRANLISRAQILKEKLDSLGFPAKIVEYIQKTSIQIQDGSIELKRNEILVKGSNGDIRKMLLSVIN